jgi:signal transduction histidine kinase
MDRLAPVLKAGRIGTWEIALPGKTMTCSDTCKGNFGRPPGEPFSYEALQATIHVDDRERVASVVEGALAGGSEFTVEYRCLWPDGNTNWIAVTGLVIRAESGEPQKMIGVTQNITERKLSEELQNRLSVSHQLLQAQEDERRRVARELHDSAGQTLAAVGINLQAIVHRAKRDAPSLLPTVLECSDLVQQLSGEIRTMSYLLHPPMLDEVGLSGALGWYVEGLEGRSSMKIKVDIPEDFPRINKEIELAVFRVVQESLTNIYRHSGSKTAHILVRTNGDELNVEIRDQGNGMTAAKLKAVQTKGSGVGLQGMRERVRQRGGKMEIESDSGGTTLYFQFPLAEPNEQRGTDR